MLGVIGGHSGGGTRADDGEDSDSANDVGDSADGINCLGDALGSRDNANKDAMPGMTGDRSGDGTGTGDGEDHESADGGGDSGGGGNEKAAP